MFDKNYLWLTLGLGLIVALFVLVIILKLRKKKYDVGKITLSDIDKMTGHEFEDYLYVLIKSLGYDEVYLTKKSRDYGADLLFRDRDQQLTVVQAKRLSEKLGLEAVQQIYTAQAYYLADKALIITSAEHRSDPCRKLASATKVRIVNRDELKELITLFKRGRVNQGQDLIEEPFDLVDFQAEDSIEQLEVKRGIVQAGDYFYRTSQRRRKVGGE
ncbi:restriction endonuclease [Halalkalibacter krulwichiae]|uniref:Restriction endonuclease n=1 Tax=Halalkalibacter krulwichiae TaxID=199441 RepID=A0A1X9MLN8_9BACI|nr:restriction endonuclease [Halalkalibacter krulwichiae]ARK31812.1 Restriction endonuclease [Halalkalibacter krulwichiae]